MHISHLIVKNFRSIESINVEFAASINVIVGPNAVGKTTILQAIRLLKALVAPRTPNETQQVLISLGAISANFPQAIFAAALVRDATKPVEIRCIFSLSEDDIDQLEMTLVNMSNTLVRSRMGQTFSNPATLLQFLASPAGQSAQATALDDVQAELRQIRTSRKITASVLIPADGSNITTGNPLSGLFISEMERKLPPFQTIFSYFPADRALPIGEVAVQLGSPDAQQQLESHTSQAQLKYTRLKNTIFSTIVMGEEFRLALLEDFEKIFTGVLKGRKIKSIGINQIGLLSVMIEDSFNGRSYEIDSLSSGEKGLILTFLLIARTLARGGIVLLDEPELHLNPAVCKDILDFLSNTYAVPNNLQVFICTHSPEILHSAHSRMDCNLYQLKSETIISRIGGNALDEFADAVKRLGSSLIDSLLFKGTIFVEGDDDVSIIEGGFGDILRKFKIQKLNGRKEIEKAIAEIQESEQKGDTVSPVFFLFDQDRKPTSLQSSPNVKLHQWQRYCIENYLIDLDAMASILKRPDVARIPFDSQGKLSNTLRSLALSQIDEVIAREIFSGFGFKNTSLTAEDVKGRSLEEACNLLADRLSAAQMSLTRYENVSWKSDFMRLAEEKKQEILPIWEVNWKDKCDGKQLFADFLKTNVLKIPLRAFKRAIVQEMKNTKSEGWQAMGNHLRQLIDEHLD